MIVCWQENKHMALPITKLKHYREKKFMTQEELAKDSNVAIGVISKAENGGIISLGSIKRLADALKITPEKLI
jgi:transcriptional regulator with XRE-family HTH domain